MLNRHFYLEIKNFGERFNPENQQRKKVHSLKPISLPLNPPRLSFLIVEGKTYYK